MNKIIATFFISLAFIARLYYNIFIVQTCYKYLKVGIVMFNKNFYPSSYKVIQLLKEGLPRHLDRILEPSAGKGDLADSFSSQVDCIEADSELSMILHEKGYQLVGTDFLSFTTYTEYDAIVMNPPFDRGDEHLIHAIELAELQVAKKCFISCILNAETIKNPFSQNRKRLAVLLQKYGATITFHEKLFSDGQRKTDVETAIIQMEISQTRNSVSSTYKNIVNSIGKETNEKVEMALSTRLTKQEIVERVKDIKTLVSQYEFHVSLIKEKFKAVSSLNYLETLIYRERNHSMSGISDHGRISDLNQNIESLRRDYWEAILSTDEFSDKLTQHGKNLLWKQLDSAKNMEISIENIEMLLMAVYQNANQMMLDSCVNMFEELTRYHNREFSSNIHFYNGWDTNNAYKLNKKIILPIRESFWTWGDSIEFDRLPYSFLNRISDMIKMFKLLKPTLSDSFEKIGTMEFEGELFRFKIFKKGTVHIWFNDLELLEQFNVICGRQFNWVPFDEEMENSKAREFMEENFNSYYQTMYLETEKSCSAGTEQDNVTKKAV